MLQNIATQTGGKYYEVNNANALPKIFQREARRVARPLVYEPKPPVSRRSSTATTKSCAASKAALPPISGFVLTTREGEPAGRSDPALAAARRSRRTRRSWPRGPTALGKAVAFTTDAGSTLGHGVDRLGRVRQVLQPDGPLVDAARRATRASSPSPPTCETARRKSSSRRWTRTTSFSTTSR